MIAGDGIDADLAAEKEEILIADVEVEDAGVFEKKLALFGDKDFEGSEIERLKVHFGVGEIGVAAEI